MGNSGIYLVLRVDYPSICSPIAFSTIRRANCIRSHFSPSTFTLMIVLNVLFKTGFNGRLVFLQPIAFRTRNTSTRLDAFMLKEEVACDPC
jgi:hypothetical protein